MPAHRRLHQASGALLAAMLVMLLAAMLMLSPGCGDDPAAPANDLWADVTLPALGRSGVVGIAARGSRVVAVGVEKSAASPATFAVQTTGGAWRVLALPATPANAVFLDVAFAAGGEAVIVGGMPAEHPVVLDERTGWSATILPAAGFLFAAAAGDGDSLLAVGVASGGLTALGVAPGAWVTDHAGFTTPQEKGLVDVTFANSTFVACGWDDATLTPVLRRLDSTGWKDVPGPGSAVIPEIREEFYAVWLEPDGSLWLGGTTIESTGGTEVFSARLARRPASGDWLEIVLPSAGAAEAVNDILRAADGSVYLACGRTAARVLRWNGMTWQEEQPAIPGQFLALAETANGAVYAAGVQRWAPGQERPLIRVRRPF